MEHANTVTPFALCANHGKRQSENSGGLLKRYRRICCLCLILVLHGSPVFAQSSQFQAGLGAWTGVGVQFVHVQSHSTYSLEVMVSVDTEPWKKRTPAYLSAGVGAALRPVGILRVIGRADYSDDIYLGLRFGPALTFLQKPTRQEKNRQFSLFLDPFLRYVRPLGQYTGFIEIGSQRPSLRLGLWISL